MATTLRRRQFFRTAGGLVLATAGGFILGVGPGLALPGRVLAAGEGLCPVCGIAPFGPLHAWTYGNCLYPQWMDRVVARESSWRSGATNPWSGAAGLCQFMPGTWADGEARFGIYGSPYEPYTALAMMDAYLRAGEWSHWFCNGAAGCEDVSYIAPRPASEQVADGDG